MDCHASDCLPGKVALKTGCGQDMQEEEPVVFGGYPVDPDMVRLVVGTTLAVIFLIIALLKPPVSLLIQSVENNRDYPLLRAASVEELVEELKANDLWEVEPSSAIQPLLFSSLPDDYLNLDYETKKKVFLHTLLPVAMVALAEIENERAALEMILGKLSTPPKDFIFDGDDIEWHMGLDKNEIFFLKSLSKKYRTNKVDKLLRRVNTVPVSLILAQGALESSWGGSRFALEGNNLFGIWTWGANGLVPNNREEGKSHRVAVYDSLLDSVRAYILMLNRVSAYSYFRKIRLNTMDSLTLANGLLYYSERRQEYISDVTTVIKTNSLQEYDECVLASSPGVSGGVRLVNLASLL